MMSRLSRLPLPGQKAEGGQQEVCLDVLDVGESVVATPPSDEPADKEEVNRFRQMHFPNYILGLFLRKK